MKDGVNTASLEDLLGYNTRRAALTIIGHFMDTMVAYDLRPVDYSVLSLVQHNPGITSRQLCSALNILPPNLVGILKAFEKRGLMLRQPHPTDGRALGLSLTSQGQDLMRRAEATAHASDLAATAKLTAAQRKTLQNLLQKIYL